MSVESEIHKRLAAHTGHPLFLEHADAVRAISAVLDKHTPTPWYEECQQHPIPDDDLDGSSDFWEAHRYVGDTGLLVCEETRIEDRCEGCTADGADDDTVMSVHYPCPTVLAVAEALGVAGSAGSGLSGGTPR